jgi:hypothetical protein
LINPSSKSVSFTAIQEVCHAPRTRMDRDFTPEWGVREQLLRVDHREPRDAASHEMLEVLVDPYGHKFVRTPDIARPAGP